jgi:hypothetical protein
MTETTQITTSSVCDKRTSTKLHEHYTRAGVPLKPATVLKERTVLLGTSYWEGVRSRHFYVVKRTPKFVYLAEIGCASYHGQLFFYIPDQPPAKESQIRVKVKEGWNGVGERVYVQHQSFSFFEEDLTPGSEIIVPPTSDELHAYAKSQAEESERQFNERVKRLNSSRFGRSVTSEVEAIFEEARLLG